MKVTYRNTVSINRLSTLNEVAVEADNLKDLESALKLSMAHANERIAGEIKRQHENDATFLQ